MDGLFEEGGAEGGLFDMEEGGAEGSMDGLFDMEEGGVAEGVLFDMEGGVAGGSMDGLFDMEGGGVAGGSMDGLFDMEEGGAEGSMDGLFNQEELMDGLFERDMEPSCAEGLGLFEGGGGVDSYIEQLVHNFNEESDVKEYDDLDYLLNL
jgi:hypothetical protein